MTSGIILVDKPAGITTFDIIRRLRKVLGNRKIGHAGVLDRMATGLVIVGVGKATKLLGIFENAYKVYEAEFTFGVKTDTYDIEGRVLERMNVDSIDRERLTELLTEFTGTIEQTPPLFSNVKVRGKRLYRYALKNEKVELPKRTVTIYSFELLDVHGNKAKFRIKCSKGTYIRSLANDMGNLLGVGAIVSRLKRTYIYPYSLDEASTIESPKIIPTKEAFKFMDEIVVDSALVSHIKNGFPVCKLLNCSKLKAPYYRLIDINSDIIAVIEKKNGSYTYRAIF